MDTDVNMNVLCRTCLVQSRDLISIYDDEKTKMEGIDCLDLLGTLTNTMPYEYDGLPKHVCLPCFQEIKRINSFKLQCINSENMLKKLLSERKIDKIEIKPEEPSCSYADHMSPETSQTTIPTTIESQGQVFEVIVKEEPDYYEPNLEVQLEDEHDGVEEEADCNETNQKFNAFDSTAEPEGSEQSRKTLQCKNCNKGRKDTAAAKKMRLYRQRLKERKCDLSSETEPSLLRRKDTAAAKKMRLYRQRLKERKCDLSSETEPSLLLFKHLGRLKKHLMNHKFCKGNFTFTCTLCDKQFNRQYSLQRHLLVSHKQQMTKEILTQSTETKTLQIENVENHIQKELETLRQCNRCKEVFKDDLTLEEHKKTHEEKLHPCELCEKVFKCSYNLKIHMMNHEEIRPFKCEQCDKTFVRNSCLNRHLKTHMGEKPFTCDICDKGFPYLYALKTHKRSHTEVRPFSCNICSMRFKFANTLKDHQRTHTGEKPFACKICSRKLSSKTNYRIHMKSHEQQTNSETTTALPPEVKEEVVS